MIDIISRFLITFWINLTFFKATEMRFTLFANDNELMEAIERFGLPEFMDAYQKCGFVDKNEQFWQIFIIYIIQ